MPSPYSDSVLGERIHALLKTEPKERGRWTYVAAAAELGINRGTLVDCCERFGIDFPKQSKEDLKVEIEGILKSEPKIRPFWTFVELAWLLGVSRTQTQTYCEDFGIKLPPHPLEGKIRALWLTKPEGGQWTYPAIASAVGMNWSWVREFCIKRVSALANDAQSPIKVRAVQR
jgi:hypothetical protein